MDSNEIVNELENWTAEGCETAAEEAAKWRWVKEFVTARYQEVREEATLAGQRRIEF